MKKHYLEVYISFLLIVFSPELISFLLTKKGILQLYATNKNIAWTLPIEWLVPIWSILYILIAFSGAIIWTKKGSHERNFAMGAWVIQLILGVLWPVCFFYVALSVLTPILITVLFMVLLILMFYTFLISRLAAYFLIPYFLMTIYKMVFHWIFYILNINL